jgi:ABC-2 type transport system ATP-binding protein
VSAATTPVSGSASKTTAGLRVEGAVRVLAGRRVLDGVELRVAAGTLVALLGPNGAGKTSLVRAICGRLRLDTGRVAVDGRDPTREPAARARLGLVPQAIALYPDLTARENLEVFAALADVPRQARRARVDEAIEWASLSERAGSLARTLSGGMQRRLNLAAAVLHRPDVLLLDEPTVGVDPQARERLHALLRDLRAGGAALLLATHDMDEAAELADRVAILVDGRVRAEGTPAELVRAHVGDARELRLGLRTPPGDAARSALTAFGLAPSDDARTWTGALTAPLDALSALTREICARGAAVDEMRLREPGLRGVFLRVAGREWDA